MKHRRLPLRDRLEILFMWKTGSETPVGAIKWASKRYKIGLRTLYRYAGTVGRDGPPFQYHESTAHQTVRAGQYMEELLLEDERALVATGSYDTWRKRQLRAKARERGAA